MNCPPSLLTHVVYNRQCAEKCAAGVVYMIYMWGTESERRVICLDERPRAGYPRNVGGRRCLWDGERREGRNIEQQMKFCATRRRDGNSNLTLTHTNVIALLSVRLSRNMSTLHGKASHLSLLTETFDTLPIFALSLFLSSPTFVSVSTADVIRRPGARAREERLSEELAKPDEATGATKADAQSSAATAATQAATTFILKPDCVLTFREEVGAGYTAR